MCDMVERCFSLSLLANAMIVIMIEDIINCLKFSQIVLIFSFIVKLRKEADDIGPAAELDHWKQRMAKFNRYVLLKCAICHD